MHQHREVANTLLRSNNKYNVFAFLSRQPTWQTGKYFSKHGSNLKLLRGWWRNSDFLLVHFAV